MAARNHAIPTIRKLIILAAVAVFGFGAQLASADPIYFDFSGVCTFDCANIGASNGDVVSGFIETTEAAVASGTLGIGDIVDFAFSVGALMFQSSTGTVDLADLVLNAAGDGFESGRLSVMQDGSALREFEFQDVWRIFDGAINEQNVIAGGTGSFSLREQSVPEPGTLALLGIGLAGLGLARRKKLT